MGTKQWSNSVSSSFFDYISKQMLSLVKTQLPSDRKLYPTCIYYSFLYLLKHWQQSILKLHLMVVQTQFFSVYWYITLSLWNTNHSCSLSKVLCIIVGRLRPISMPVECNWVGDYEEHTKQNRECHRGKFIDVCMCVCERESLNLLKRLLNC